MPQPIKPFDKDSHWALLAALAAGVYCSIFYIFNNITLLTVVSILFIMLIMTLPLLILTVTVLFIFRLTSKEKYTQTCIVFLIGVFLVFVLHPTLLEISLVRSALEQFQSIQKSLANIIFVVVPAGVMTLIFRKYVQILAVFLGTMALVALLMNIGKILGNDIPATVKTSQPGLESLRLSNKPNIYFILADGYASLAYLRNNNINVSGFVDYLTESGFRLYDDTYSNYQPTTSAMPAILNMEHHYYSLTGWQVDFSEVSKSARAVIGGDNLVTHILRNNGYSIQYIHGGSYLLLQGCSADFCFPAPDGFSGARLVLSHIFKKDLLNNQDKVWSTTSNEHLLEQSINQVTDSSTDPRFQYIHTYDPAHAPSNVVGTCNEVQEKSAYGDRIREVNTYLEQQIEGIISNDSDAVIIVTSDHGPFISNNCDLYNYIDNESEYRDRAGILTAIRWPQDYDGKYDNRIFSAVNLFRYILASIAEDDNPLLLSAVPDDVYVRGYGRAFKVIENAVTLESPEEYLRKEGTNELSEKAESVPCEDLSRASLAHQGMCFYERDDSVTALKIFREALAQNPKSAVAFNNVCATHNSLEQWVEGIRACEQALTIDPEFQLAKNNLAWAKSKLEIAGSVVIECDDPGQGSLQEQGMCFYNQGDKVSALKKFQEALTQNPTSAVAFNNICATHNSLEQWAEGIRACEQALTLDPEFQLAKNNLAWAKSQLKSEDNVLR